MLPIGLLVQRKTLVPVNGVVHKFRSDWKKVVKIEYEEASRIFKIINGTGPIATEAQFCYLLFSNYGPGEYMITAWRKKRKGLWQFLKVILTPEGFRRVEKKITQEQRENKELKADYNKVQLELKKAETEDERNTIKEEAADLLEEVSMNKDIIEAENMLTKRGPSPYLKASVPVFQNHDYESWSDAPIKKQAEVVQSQESFW